MRTTQLAVAVAVCLVVFCAGASVVPLASQGHRHYSGFITFDNIWPGLRRIIFGPDPSTTTQESDADLVKTVTPSTSTNTVVADKREAAGGFAIMFGEAATARPAPVNPRPLGHVTSTPRHSFAIGFPGARAVPSFVSEERPLSYPGAHRLSPIYIPVRPSEDNNPEDTEHISGDGNGDFLFPSLLNLNKKVIPNRRVTTVSTSSRVTTDLVTPNILVITDHQMNNCTLQNGVVIYQGTCPGLLTKGPCADGEWLVLKDDSPMCVPRPCPFRELQYNGSCVNPSDRSVCGKGQILYVDPTGSTMCDCEEGHLYDAVSDNCYVKHNKGPCNVGQYFEMSKSNSTVMECVRNECVTDDFVQDPLSNVCFKKMFNGYCEDQYLIFHEVNNTVVCGKLAFIRTILGVTTVEACPPGSRRDYIRQCREEFLFPSVFSFPALYGDCGVGFIKDPRGICRRTRRLFG